MIPLDGFWAAFEAALLGDRFGDGDVGKKSGDVPRPPETANNSDESGEVFGETKTKPTHPMYPRATSLFDQV